MGQRPFVGAIVGIAADAREQGINSAPAPTVYWCIAAPVPDPNYLIRTNGDPIAFAGSVRRAVHQVEPNRSVFNLTTLNQQLSDAFGENRLRTVLLSMFALTAVSLACIGLYGTLSYLVNLRRREVGLRIALGAQRPQIVRKFLLQGLRVCAIGCVCGLVLAAASGRVLAGMLYGISRFDAGTMATVVAVLLVVGACAALIPSLRAARTDPMNVLREG
jgi:putative ABC transport system permease protein